MEPSLLQPPCVYTVHSIFLVGEALSVQVTVNWNRV